MTNKKLLMFAVAGLLAPAAYEGVATAEVHNGVVTVAVPAPVNDTAPVTGNPPRLRRTDQEQAGFEMPAFGLFGDGKTGLFFGMTTELNKVRATDNVQLSLTPFKLQADPQTGQVSAVADTVNARFVTTNRGNERRNANAPTAMTVNGGSVILVKYNAQINGNDTKRYVQGFNAAGVRVLNQVVAYAKDNDDCSMNQDGDPGSVINYDAATNTTKMVEWAGCNGNGQDKGWAFVTSLKCDKAVDPTTCTFTNVFDVALAQREERSRGKCSVAAGDTSFAVCSATEGNNQPQRNGAWLYAIDLNSGARGSDQQQTILWKQQIAGRIDNNTAAGGRRTYAQRAVHERIMTADATTGALVPSDKIIYRYGDAAGNNNTNQGKGGTYYTNMLMVIQPTRTKPIILAKAVDMSPTLLGLGGTHLGAAAAVFGTTGNLTPGLVFLNGSHTGGGYNAQIRSVALDPATNKFSDLGMQAVAPHDRHLYSNYLGNNPGNQGRDHSQLAVVKNPFTAAAGGDAYLLITATAGKTMASTCTGCLDTVSKPEVKLTGLLTVTGIAQTPNAAPGNTGSGSGSNGSGSNGSNTGNTGSDNSSDPGTTLGGCSAGSASSGFAMFLLVGLAAFVRRRR